MVLKGVFVGGGSVTASTTDGAGEASPLPLRMVRGRDSGVEFDDAGADAA
jgi:hypothetical protein